MKKLLIILLLGASPVAVGQVVDPANVVIRNVHIVAPEAEDVTVNLLIRDNKLEIISKDKIPTPAGFVALDAEGGYVVGTLRLEESPSFIILDGDPREDFDVLLDTDTHVVFAVHAGELRKNSLLYASGTLDEVEEEPEPREHVYGVHLRMPALCRDLLRPLRKLDEDDDDEHDQRDDDQ